MQYDFEITPHELNTILREKHTKSHLLDVRTPSEFSLCALQNSVNIPLDELSSHLLRLDQTASYVVICHHGIRSLQACLLMHQRGFTNVKSLKGGLDAWSRCIDSSLPLY